MTRLSLDTLPSVPADVPTPGYLDASPRIGIVHLGVGNFHRSHQAMYIDRILTADPEAPWAICGIGMREEDRAIAEAMAEQNCLYSLSIFHPDGEVDTRVSASIRDYVFCPDDPAEALRRLTDPAVRVVSLTITESGYVEDPDHGRTAADDPDIRRDVADDLAAPRSAFGLIVAALRARRAAGIVPFTVMTCDNIQHNGAVARACVVATARLVDEELADWIDGNVSFPSTMVDRITPRPTAEQLRAVEANLGMQDRAAVVAEPFVQWVIEDDFPAGRPLLEEVGAVFVEDIDAYEAMKLRLLNGAHQVMAYVGILAGHRYVHEAMADPEVKHWVDRYSYELALPTLDLPAGVDGDRYIRALEERFANPAIADTLERLATDSPDRMGKFVLPVLVDAKDEPGFTEIAATILASWATTIATTDSPVILASVSKQLLEAVRGDDPASFLSRVEWLAAPSKDDGLRDLVRGLRNSWSGRDPS